MTGKRHSEAVQCAADLLREFGPTGLTSAAVGERMGITQSAVYRHVDSMEDLARLASEVVISDLNATLRGLLLSPERNWSQIDDLGVLARALVEPMLVEHRSFHLVDRWRFEKGSLGAGIRGVIAEGVDLVAFVLESQWRREFGYAGALDARARSAQRAHAAAIYDDGLAVARLARDPARAVRVEDVAYVLRCRLLSGWSSYVIGMNARVGLPFPAIDLDDGVVLP
jgi:AcrR family transcriptional regulator